MLKNLKYNLPDGYDEKQIVRNLADQYILKKEPAIAERIRFFDTFDWRLFNKSLVLYGSGSKLFLRKLAKHEILYSVKSSSRPIFIWEFPYGELKKHLAPIIRMRALLKLAEVYSRSTPYRVLNRDEKTVARLVYEDLGRQVSKMHRRGVAFVVEIVKG